MHDCPTNSLIPIYLVVGGAVGVCIFASGIIDLLFEGLCVLLNMLTCSIVSVWTMTCFLFGWFIFGELKHFEYFER